MEKIIDPIAKELYSGTQRRIPARHTNKAENLLYIITAKQAQTLCAK
jgi:hypothetical protein